MEPLLQSPSQSLSQPSSPIYNIVFFINSESGGKNGELLANSKIKGIEMNPSQYSFLYFYKMNDLTSRKKGLGFVENLVHTVDHSVNKIVVLAGGGDGTVNWLLEELIEARIDFSKVLFSVFPLGTGNDFAKNLGWKQYKLFENGFQDLHQFLQKVRYSRIENLDVWEVEVDYREGGYISQHKQGETKKIPNKPFSKQITNYFSFGMDARVGYNFDSHRSNFQLFNYALYCLIGCFSKFKRAPNLPQVVANMEESDSEADVAEDGRINIVFKSEEERVRLKKFRNIVALNINSYMGGVNGVWQYSKQSGLSSQSATSYVPNDHSDGLLEFVAFKDEWSLGFERVFRGRARKIAQGKGPFKFQFEKGCQKTYLNFDGEYYKIQHPQSITIKRSPHFAKHPLNVLRCPTTN